MAIIKTITPVHIGSGEKNCIIKKGKYNYLLDKVIEIYVENGAEKTTKNISKKIFESSRSNDGKNNVILKAIGIDAEELPLSAIISNNPDFGSDIQKGISDLYLTQKSLDKLVIPGSTIKGMINNLFWYYFLDKNQSIRKKIEENPNEIGKKIRQLDDCIKKLKSFLRIPDVMINCESKCCTVNSYSKNTNTVPMGSFETIPYNTIVNCEFIKDLSQDDLKLLSKVKKEMLIKSNVDYFSQVIDDYCSFLSNLKEKLPKVNKKFMLKIVKMELDFVNSSSNEGFDHANLINFYKKIIEQLNEGKMIIQIGKMTNYLDKTFTFVFEDIYEKNFTLFRPNRNKRYPKIESMKITKIGDQYLPLGFIEIEL